MRVELERGGDVARHAVVTHGAIRLGLSKPLAWSALALSALAARGPGRKLVFQQPLQLANSRLVWLRRFDEEVQPVEPEAVPVGQLIRVLTPEDNDVSCPGYLVVGVNVA